MYGFIRSIVRDRGIYCRNNDGIALIWWSTTYQLGDQWYRLPAGSNVRHTVDVAVERIIAWMPVTKDNGERISVPSTSFVGWEIYNEIDIRRVVLFDKLSGKPRFLLFFQLLIITCTPTTDLFIAPIDLHICISYIVWIFFCSGMDRKVIKLWQ